MCSVDRFGIVQDNGSTPLHPQRETGWAVPSLLQVVGMAHVSIDSTAECNPPGGGTLSAALSGRNPSVQLAVSVLPSVQLPYSYLPVTLIRSGIVPLQVGERRLPSDAACWVGTRGGSIFQVAVAVAVVLTSKAVMKTSKCMIFCAIV